MTTDYMIMNTEHNLMPRILTTTLVVGVLMLIGAAVAHACPSCGLEVLEGQKGGAGLADGFTYSMVGMASAPFLVFTSVAAYIYRKYRRRP